MKTEQIVMCVVALLLGMLLANMLTNVCGCKTTEGLQNMPSTGIWNAVTTGMSGDCKSNDINICNLTTNSAIDDLPPSCNTMDKVLLKQVVSSIPDIRACSTPPPRNAAVTGTEGGGQGGGERRDTVYGSSSCPSGSMIIGGDVWGDVSCDSLSQEQISDIYNACSWERGVEPHCSVDCAALWSPYYASCKAYVDCGATGDPTKLERIEALKNSCAAQQQLDAELLCKEGRGEDCGGGGDGPAPPTVPDGDGPPPPPVPPPATVTAATGSGDGPPPPPVPPPPPATVTAAVGSGDGPPPPPVPPGGSGGGGDGGGGDAGTIYYVSVTVGIVSSDFHHHGATKISQMSSVEKNQFMRNFAAEVASALNQVDPHNVYVTSLPNADAPSLSFIIFAETLDARLAIATDLDSQINDPNSILRGGWMTSNIDPTASNTIYVHTGTANDFATLTEGGVSGVAGVDAGQGWSRITTGTNPTRRRDGGDWPFPGSNVCLFEGGWDCTDTACGDEVAEVSRTYTQINYCGNCCSHDDSGGPNAAPPPPTGDECELNTRRDCSCSGCDEFSSPCQNVQYKVTGTSGCDNLDEDTCVSSWFQLDANRGMRCLWDSRDGSCVASGGGNAQVRNVLQLQHHRLGLRMRTPMPGCAKAIRTAQ